MRKNLKASIAASVAILAALALQSCQTPTGTWTNGLVFDRVIVVVLENTDYSVAVNEPYIKSLTEQGALLTNFHGNTHPSYGNYLSMVAGKFFWTFFDRQRNLNSRTIADLLEEKNLTWKNYAEEYPGNCYY